MDIASSASSEPENASPATTLPRAASAPTFRVRPPRRHGTDWNPRHAVMFSAMNGVTQQNARNYFSRPRELRDNVLMGHITKAELEYYTKLPFRRDFPKIPTFIQTASPPPPILKERHFPAAFRGQYWNDSAPFQMEHNNKFFREKPKEIPRKSTFK